MAELARGLIELGHRPTVFATGDSRCEGLLRWTMPRPVWPLDTLTELRHVAFAWTEIAAGAFDVVHVNHPLALPFCRLVRRPTVATVHHDRADTFAVHYASYPENAYVAISERQRELAPRVPFEATIHHGLAVDRYPAGSGDEGYCAYLGRLAKEKGTDIAIDAARRAGAPIRLGGAAHAHEREFFEREIVPRLALPGVEWLGEVGGARKIALLRGASCLLFPIQWEEPFGLVMIEAMLVGTPVVAFPGGSVVEVIDEGITGYVVRSVDEMVGRIQAIAAFDRRRCRARARERWSSSRMAREHVDLYRRVIAAHGRPRARGAGEAGGDRVHTGAATER